MKRPLTPAELAEADAAGYDVSGYDGRPVEIPDEVGPRTSPIAAGTRAAAASAIPTAAGGAVFMPAFTAGTALSAPLGPFAPVGGVIAGLGAGYAASRLAGAGQQALMPKAWEEQLAADIAAHPTATTVGQLATLPLGGLRPSISGTKAAATGLTRLAVGAPLSLEEKAALKLAAGGAALGAGQEAVIQQAEGRPFDPKQIALSSALGATFNKPNAIGRAYGFPEIPQRTIVNPELLTRAATPSRRSQYVETGTTRPAVGMTMMDFINKSYGPEVATAAKPAEVSAQRILSAEEAKQPVVPREGVEQTDLLREVTKGLKGKGVVNAPTPEYTDTLTKELLLQHNIKVSQNGTLVDAAGNPVKGTALLGNKVREVVQNPGRARLDTLPHEDLHYFRTELEQSAKAGDIKAQQLLTQWDALSVPGWKANEAIRADRGLPPQDIHEFTVSEQGLEFVKQQFNLLGESRAQKWWNDTRALLKTKWSNNATLEDLRRAINFRVVNEQTMGKFVGEEGPRGKVGEGGLMARLGVRNQPPDEKEERAWPSDKKLPFKEQKQFDKDIKDTQKYPQEGGTRLPYPARYPTEGKEIWEFGGKENKALWEMLKSKFTPAQHESFWKAVKGEWSKDDLDRRLEYEGWNEVDRHLVSRFVDTVSQQMTQQRSSRNQPEDDRTQYETLQNRMRELLESEKPEDAVEFKRVWQQSEDIKNRHGGMPPTKERNQPDDDTGLTPGSREWMDEMNRRGRERDPLGSELADLTYGPKKNIAEYQRLMSLQNRAMALAEQADVSGHPNFDEIEAILNERPKTVAEFEDKLNRIIKKSIGTPDERNQPDEETKPLGAPVGPELTLLQAAKKTEHYRTWLARQQDKDKSDQAFYEAIMKDDSLRDDIVTEPSVVTALQEMAKPAKEKTLKHRTTAPAPTAATATEQQLKAYRTEGQKKQKPEPTIEPKEQPTFVTKITPTGPIEREPATKPHFWDTKVEELGNQIDAVKSKEEAERLAGLLDKDYRDLQAAKNETGLENLRDKIAGKATVNRMLRNELETKWGLKGKEQGRFQPDEEERIVSAATKAPDGTITKGDNHYQAAYYRSGEKKGLLINNAEAGFVTNTGRFLSRKDALPVAYKAGQLWDTSADRYLTGELTKLDTAHIKDGRYQPDEDALQRQPGEGRKQPSPFTVKEEFKGDKAKIELFNEAKEEYDRAISQGLSTEEASNLPLMKKALSLTDIDFPSVVKRNQPEEEGGKKPLADLGVQTLIQETLSYPGGDEYIRAVIEKDRIWKKLAKLVSNTLKVSETEGDELAYKAYKDDTYKKELVSKLGELNGKMLSDDLHTLKIAQEMTDAYIKKRNEDQKSQRNMPDEETSPTLIAQDPSKQGFLRAMSSTFDKVRPYSVQLSNAFKRWEAQKDAYWGMAQTAIKDLEQYNKADVLRVRNLHRESFRNKTELPAFTGKDAEISKILTRYYHDQIGQERRDLRIKIKSRKAGLNPSYVDDSLNDKTIALFTERPTSPEANHAKNIWAEFVAIESEGKISYDDARKHIDDYIGAMGARDSNYLSVNFGALRKVEGYGLPEGLRETDAINSLYKYGRRAAADLAMFKELESKPEIASKLKLYGPDGKIPSPPDGDTTTYSQLKEVQDAMGWVTGRVTSAMAKQMPRTSAFVRLVNNLLLGPATAARNIAQMPVNMIPYINKFSDLSAAMKGIANIAEHSRASLETAARQPQIDRVMFNDIADAPDRFTSALRWTARQARKYQGAELAENVSRDLTFAIGKELALSNIAGARAGSAKSKQFLDKFSLLVDEDPTTLRGAELDKAVNQIAKNFVDRNQGTYGGRGLPAGIVDSQFAPFYSLKKWSIEKSNVIYQDVVKPFMDGSNRLPMLTYLFGTVLTGAAIQQLNELLTNKKGQDPKWQEALDQPTAHNIISELATLMQLSSFAGIIGDSMKVVSDISHGKKPRNIVSFPTATAMIDLSEKTTDMIEAINHGEDPWEVMKAYTMDLLQHNVQAARMIANRSTKEEDVERGDKFRDLRVFNELQGKPAGNITTSNPYLGLESREYKREKDITRAASMLPEMIGKTISKSGNDYEQLSKNFRALKGNSYQTMPGLEKMPLSFQQYYQFLVDTQGKEAADERLMDFMQQRMVNKAKSSLVPSF